MESQRQKKVAGILQEDLSLIIQKNFQPMGSLVTVTEVRVTPDLSIAKVYLSVFPTQLREQVYQSIDQQTSAIRKELGNKIAKVVRIVPELYFEADYSSDHAEQVDNELRGKGENPIL